MCAPAADRRLYQDVGINECFICDKHRLGAAATGGIVYEDDLVSAGHVFPRSGAVNAYLGQLTVEPKRHAPASLISPTRKRPRSECSLSCSPALCARSNSPNTSTASCSATAWTTFTCCSCRAIRERRSSITACAYMIGPTRREAATPRCAPCPIASAEGCARDACPEPTPYVRGRRAQFMRTASLHERAESGHRAFGRGQGTGVTCYRPIRCRDGPLLFVDKGKWRRHHSGPGGSACST